MMKVNQSVSEIAHAKCGRLPVNLWQPKKGLGGSD
jgi:hypothetical protein